MKLSSKLGKFSMAACLILSIYIFKEWFDFKSEREELQPIVNALEGLQSAIKVGTSLYDYTKNIITLDVELKRAKSRESEFWYDDLEFIGELYISAQKYWDENKDVMTSQWAGPTKSTVSKYQMDLDGDSLDDHLFTYQYDKNGYVCNGKIDERNQSCLVRMTADQFLKLMWLRAQILYDSIITPGFKNRTFLSTFVGGKYPLTQHFIDTSKIFSQ